MEHLIALLAQLEEEAVGQGLELEAEYESGMVAGALTAVQKDRELASH